MLHPAQRILMVVIFLLYADKHFTFISDLRLFKHYLFSETEAALIRKANELLDHRQQLEDNLVEWLLRNGADSDQVCNSIGILSFSFLLCILFILLGWKSNGNIWSDLHLDNTP